MKRNSRTEWMIGLAALIAFGMALPYAAFAATADFTLKEAGGDKTFSLSQAKGKYVALHFLLKTDCPICLRLTKSYASKGPGLSDVEFVFIKPDEDADTLKWAAGLSPEDPSNAPTIFRDPDAKLADAFDIPNGYAFHGETVHFPALIVIDPHGKEVFRHVGKNTMDRISFEKFSAKLAELNHEAAVGNFNLDKSGLALQGYDVVSYATGKPAKGKAEFATAFGGATYRFADAKNRDAFLAAPDTYLPAYGGWCATAMAQGKKVEIDPENYKISGGRLFLFYKSLLSNAIGDWNKDESKSTAAADNHWREIAGE